MRVVTFKIEEELLEALDTYAKIKGIPRSEVIRRAIQLYLRIEEKNTRPEPKRIKLYS